MEADNLEKKKINHGLNIKRARIRKDIKQEKLAALLELSQQTISRYENTVEIEDSILERFAKALNVPLEELKVEEGETPNVFIENNTITNNDNAVGNLGYNQDSNFDNRTVNPLEKIIELYERMLKEEKDKNDSLEKRLSALEQKIKNK